MKLDAVVDVDVATSAVERRFARSLRGAIVLGLSVLIANAAIALDGIDLDQPVAEAGPGECPKLIQIKYPFLSCANGQIGQSDADENWENSRRIPFASDFVEGNGYWGDDLNRD